MALLPDEANDQEQNDCSLDSSLDSSWVSTPFWPTKDESECSEAGSSVETKIRKEKLELFQIFQNSYIANESNLKNG